MGYNQRQAARGYRLIWREGSMQSCWATTSIRFVHFQMIRRGFSRSSYACVWRRSPIVVTTFLLVKRALLEWRVQISSCASHSSANLFLRVSGFIFSRTIADTMLAYFDALCESSEALFCTPILRIIVSWVLGKRKGAKCLDSGRTPKDNVERIVLNGLIHDSKRSVFVTRRRQINYLVHTACANR